MAQLTTIVFVDGTAALETLINGLTNGWTDVLSVITTGGGYTVIYKPQ